MSRTYAFAGHSPELAQLELSSLGLNPVHLDGHLFRLASVPTNKDAVGSLTRLATELTVTTPDSLLSDLTKIIETDSAKNLAISNYTSHSLTSADLSNLKSDLTRSVRLLSFATSGHSLIALRKQHVSEFSLIQDQDELIITRTTWIQDADDWAFRDRSRPYQDIKRGMLPPKLARTMVNLASQGQEGRVLDPFCGTGTILMEAMLLGHQVAGSDTDQAAVQGTERNLSWLASQYQLTSTPTLQPLDATHLLPNSFPPIDYIVTEPYLGPLVEAAHLPEIKKLKNIARGLDKLYRGFLRSAHPLLPAGNRLAMVIPRFSLKGRSIPTLTIDTTTSLGYNYVDSVDYAKPQATVIRQITILERSNHE